MSNSAIRILVINPNTTESMTKAIESAANAVASSNTEIIARNPISGPASIQGYYDEAICIPGVLELIRDTPDFDAVIIACFDDTGLDAARCITDAPVVGIGESAYHIASLISNKFSVVTTLSRSVPALEQNLIRYGLSTRCIRVRASDVPVLELEQPKSDARKKISNEIRLAITEDHAEAVVLGCAGMADIAKSLSDEHGLPVLDGVACAVSLCEGMVRLNVKTSKVGGYAIPLD